MAHPMTAPMQSPLTLEFRNECFRGKPGGTRNIGRRIRGAHAPSRVGFIALAETSFSLSSRIYPGGKTGRSVWARDLQLDPERPGSCGSNGSEGWPKSLGYSRRDQRRQRTCCRVGWGAGRLADCGQRWRCRIRRKRNIGRLIRGNRWLCGETPQLSGLAETIRATR